MKNRKTNKNNLSIQNKEQTRERLSLYGHNPEDTIRVFMQIPVKRVIKREQNQRDKKS
jgi:hypothetical protein